MTEEGQAREYDSLQDALSNWGDFKSRPGDRDKVIAVAEDLVTILGDIVEIRIPANEPYISLRFASCREKIGAYIQSGFVDHIVQIEGSRIPDAHPHMWRSELSTAQSGSVKLKETPARFELCPKDRVEFPKNSECPVCGWTADHV